MAQLLEMAENPIPGYQHHSTAGADAGPVYLTRPQASATQQIKSIAELVGIFQQGLGQEFPQGLDRRAAEKAGGLAALVFHQLNDFWANRQGGMLPYSKSVLSVLHRTDFHSMYRSLENPAKKYFSPMRIAAAWWESVEDPERKLGHLAQHCTHESHFEDKAMEGGHPGYPLDAWLASVVDPKDLPQRPMFPAGGRPTIAAEAAHWDDERVGGGDSSSFKNKDLMSCGAVGYNSISLGAMGMYTEDANFSGAPLSVVEFRDLANAPALPWNQWAWLAREMHKFYQRAANVKMKDKDGSGIPKLYTGAA